jgi:hypothetical protein
MSRAIRQSLPLPPPQYDQEYIAQLADAVNRYMAQAQAPGEITAARYIMVDPPLVPDDYPTTALLPTGTLYLRQVPGAPAGTYYLTVVKKSDV